MSHISYQLAIGRRDDLLREAVQQRLANQRPPRDPALQRLAARRRLRLHQFVNTGTADIDHTRDRV